MKKGQADDASRCYPTVSHGQCGWVIERTFGWLNKWRRLSKDYEVLPQTSEALIQVAMITLMVQRLARPRRAVHQAAQARPRPLSAPTTRAA
ncbi:MAG TPA: transposase [Chloroflexota bacterium]|nr:transposase [Chloroflexota bacterium]